MADTKVTDEGLKEVAKLQNLEELDLENTQITDEGLKEVAKLQRLVLYCTALKSPKRVATELKKALPNCEIDSDFD